jgi:4-amino-4-deoxy-L-arabinose transferase-like glycosyltransferase
MKFQPVFLMSELMQKIKKPLLVLLLLAILWVPRLAKLDSFVTLDEPFWLSVGGNFYYALGQRELEKTVYEYHPAVTTMWIVTAAFLIYFPEYRGFGQGYFDVDKNKFDPFLLLHNISPLHLLYISRLIQVAVIVLFALAIYYFLSKLFGQEKAFLVTAFTSSAPYFLGHSRVLSHEAMLAFFVLTSIVSMVVYLEVEARWFYLIISAASAGFAQLTKSSAMAMIPVIALMLAVSAFTNIKKIGLGRAVWTHLRILGLWLLGLIIVYFVVWPGMWVAPGEMLYNVYGNAFSYAFQGARLQVTHELVPSRFSLAAPGNEIISFITQLIWYATPASWAGMLLAGVFLFQREKLVISATYKRLVLYLILAAFMFILLFSVAHGRDSTHYIMTSYVSMDAVAALGWCGLLGWLGAKLKKGFNPLVFMGWALALVFFQLGSALSFYPYYFTYSNPIMVMRSGGMPISDYGEGFEHAGAYLAQKPNAEALKVLAVHGRGPLSYFFPGQTTILNLLFLDDPGMPSLLERMVGTDYLVINDAVGPRSERTKLFVDALSSTAPEKVIQVKGVSTIRIYRIADLPPSFYGAISK